MPISCHNLHNVPCLPSLAWCRNLIPGQHNDGSPSRVRLLGGSQCLQPSRRILAQNTRKLPHPAWGPNPKRTGRRQQEWASKQRPPSETGSSLQDAMEILREKNRGMATERSWLPLPTLLPPHLLPQLDGSPHQRGRGSGGGLDLGPQMTRCMLSDRHEEASN